MKSFSNTLTAGLAVFISNLLLVAGTAAAQAFTDDAALSAAYLKAIDSLLANGETISMHEAQKSLETGGQPVAVTLTRPSTTVPEAHTLYERARQSTVITGCAYLCPRCDNVHLSESSGYVIDPSGIIVTNYHVVAAYAYMKDGNRPKGFFVRTANGQTFAVQAILAASKENDLAILRLKTNGVPLPAMALAGPAKVGDKIYVLGHPQGMHYFLSQGNVTNKYMESAGEADHKFYRPMMAVSADYATGSSGGPVIDIYGNVAGTVSNTRMLLHNDINAGVQMIIKNTVPVESLRKMISGH